MRILPEAGSEPTCAGAGWVSTPLSHQRNVSVWGAITQSALSKVGSETAFCRQARQGTRDD
jgi:hypothetical protein